MRRRPLWYVGFSQRSEVPTSHSKETSDWPTVKSSIQTRLEIPIDEPFNEEAESWRTLTVGLHSGGPLNAFPLTTLQFLVMRKLQGVKERMSGCGTQRSSDCFSETPLLALFKQGQRVSTVVIHRWPSHGSDCFSRQWVWGFTALLVYHGPVQILRSELSGWLSCTNSRPITAPWPAKFHTHLLESAS